MLACCKSAGRCKVRCLGAWVGADVADSGVGGHARQRGLSRWLSALARTCIARVQGETAMGSLAISLVATRCSRRDQQALPVAFTMLMKVLEAG